MSQKIPSPLTLDLTDTRAFKTWLYQLWQSSGGTTDTAQDVVDNYVTPNFVDQETVNQSFGDGILLQIQQELTEIKASFDSGVLLQVQQELAEISKRLDEIELNRAVNEQVTIEPNYPELQTEELSKRLDEIYLFLGNPT
jgi:hypothetical protein